MSMQNLHGRFSLVAALVIGLGVAAVGCGSDPDNGTGGGTGGSGGGGTGGTTGGGSLGAIKGTALATFDSTTEDFTLSDYADPNATNLGAAGSTATPVISLDSADGDPTPGALSVTLPFSDYPQYVDVIKNFGETNLQDWTGKKLHVRVKIQTPFSGDVAAPGGAQIHVLTTTAYTYGGKYTNIAAGSAWQEFTIDLSTVTATGFDPSQVIQFGIQLLTGDGTNATGKPTAGVALIDSFSLE